MTVSVEIAANKYHQLPTDTVPWLYLKDIVILTYKDNADNETEIYIQYNVEIGKYQISCFTQGDTDHTVFTYTP